MPIAYNDKTGEALRLDENGAWSPTKLAHNPQTGEMLALDGAQWVGVKASPPPEKSFLEKAGDFTQGLRRVRDNALTLGFGDELAGVAGGVGPAIGAMFDKDKSVADEFGKGYTEARDRARGEEKVFRDANPGTALATDLAVGLAVPIGNTARGVEAVAQGAPRFARYAGIGAATGGVAGAGYADGDLGDRAAGAATGAAVGGALGGAIPLAASAIGSVAERVGRPLMDRIGQGPARAVDRKILQAIERDGSTVDQVQARLRTLGPEATIADAAGENTAGLVEAAANQPGPGRQMASRVLQGRQKEAGDRIKAAAQRELGDGGFYESLDDLNLARREAAAPLYDQAYAQNFINSEALDTLMQRPSMRSALTRAHRIAAEEGRDPNALGLAMNEAGDVVFTRAPSMQTHDYIKRGLDDVVEQFRDPVTGRLRLDESGRAINATRAAFVKELRDLNPVYADALDAWSGPSQMMDAMAKGRSFARPDAEITEKIVSGLSSAEKDAFLLGVRRGIDDIVDRTGSMADATRKLAGTPKMQTALAAAFPDTGSYRRFMADLMRESRFNQTRNTALSGSPTARRLAGQEDVGIDPMPLADIAQGNLLAGARGIFKQVTQNTKKLPDTQAQALARALLDYNPAANAATLDRLRGGTNVLALTDDQRRALAAALAGEVGAQFPAITSR